MPITPDITVGGEMTAERFDQLAAKHSGIQVDDRGLSIVNGAHQIMTYRPGELIAGPASKPMAPPKTDDIELRLRAASLIREHGWIQDWAGNAEHGYCLYGALSEASTAVTAYHSAIVNIARKIIQKGSLPETSMAVALNLEARTVEDVRMSAGFVLTEFNDTPQRTVEDVLEALEPAAAA